jgi:hypothetical protein
MDRNPTNDIPGVENPLPTRFVAFVKSECPTCALVAPVLRQLADAGDLTVLSQDDPAFPPGLADVVDDTSLEWSFRYDIDTVPTLLLLDSGKERSRAIGWERSEWQALTGISDLGAELPALRPGCGAKNVEPGVREQLLARYGDTGFASRRIAYGTWDDPVEMCFERGWTDGLPVVPPTDARIVAMLAGTSRRADELVGEMPPNLKPCTVEKVAINAVMAGCKPEYMPVVLAAVEAALEPKFTLHGLLCSTCFSGPVIVVNGPIARAIGMNSGANALGQGNRANATIGRALQLLVRNVGGGIPGGIDQATLGNPGKYTFCFAEDESDPVWEPLAARRGVPAGRDAITLFQGDGIQGFVDQRSRTPQELTRSLAASLFAVAHPKLCEFTNAMLVLSPEHYGIFRDAGWKRRDIEAALDEALRRPGHDLIQGAQGIGEGISPSRAGETVSKFWPGGLLIVRAGGAAGLFSAILAGWTGGRFREESQPITREIKQ